MRRNRLADGGPRVVYIHQYYKDPDESAGSGTRSHEFAKRLARAGFDVHIITSDRSRSRFRGWATARRDGYEVHRISVPYSHQMSYLRRAWAFLRFAAGSGFYARKLRGDLVFATSTPLTVIIPALVARTFRGTKQVFEVRDLWPELPIALGVLRGPLMIVAARWLERVAYRTSAHIIALSPGMKDGVLRTGVAPSRVTMIPNAADLDSFGQGDGEQNPWLATHPELLGRPLVVYCGTMNKLNGVGYLVELAARTKDRRPDIAFVVVGSGTERQAIEAQAERMGVLGVNFFRYDRVSKSEVANVMSAATLVTSLFIPLKEMESNSANKFFDGLAAGRAVAINYGGWHKELIEQNEAGIFLSPIDYDLAAQSITSLIGDQGRCLRLGRNARQLAEQSFSRDQLAAQLTDVFKRVLGSRHP